MDYEIFISQLDSLIAVYDNMKAKSQYNDLSDFPKPDRQSLMTRTIAAIHRISGQNSIYSNEVERILKQDPLLHLHTSSIIGVAKALKEDIGAGYTQSLTELVHADIFSDFLDMSKHLNDNGYKDSAAVIAGSTLESHLKKLAVKNGISTLIGGKPIKASQLNVDLTKANIYNNLDQKNVTAWLDLRNKAAHGHYADYNIDQVKILISSIQDFITRNSA